MACQLIGHSIGQSCSAGSRVLVQASVYDEFLDLFLSAVQAIKVGDPSDPETFQGPQVSKLQVSEAVDLGLAAD
jgi:aldehyde dehydrogenase (NAD+)